MFHKYENLIEYGIYTTDNNQILIVLHNNKCLCIPESKIVLDNTFELAISRKIILEYLQKNAGDFDIFDIIQTTLLDTSCFGDGFLGVLDDKTLSSLSDFFETWV